MTLSTKLGVIEISTLWHLRLPLLIQMYIKVVPSPRLSRIGMPSPILWTHLLKMRRIVLPSSLLWWELGTYSLITGPGEWLSFRRFTSKLSWSWWNNTFVIPKYWYLKSKCVGPLEFEITTVNSILSIRKYKYEFITTITIEFDESFQSCHHWNLYVLICVVHVCFMSYMYFCWRFDLPSGHPYSILVRRFCLSI